MKDPIQYVIVIGASAGGLNALSELVAQLDKRINAAVFIVMHLSRRGISDFLVHRLQQYTTLPCTVAKDEEPIKNGYIYVAPPNYHLLVNKDKIVIGRGPEENRWRPSIDVLFRSAAAAYSTRTIGVVLTGLLDDGASGMWAIKRCGGICVVQDPNQAEYPDMPLAVMNRMEVDHCVSLESMGALLLGITDAPPNEEMPLPPDVAAEARIAEKVATGIENVAALGEHSKYACPECGGGLWTIEEGKMSHYRCHVGHSFSENDLAVRQVEALESTLWVALRMMEERKELIRKMEEQTAKRGFTRTAADHRQKADEIEVHIKKLRDILFATQRADYSSGGLLSGSSM